MNDIDTMLMIHKKNMKPKDLGPSRMKFDEDLVQRCYETIEAWGNPFLERDSLVQICSGIEATPLVQEDLLEAENKGKLALDTFIESRIKSNTIEFYSPIKKQRMRSFKDLSFKKVCKVKEKSVTIAAERSIFGKLLIIAKNRPNVSMKELMCFPLGPIPWSLALPDGGLVKTVKSKLLLCLEKDVETIESLPPNVCTIFDGMVLLQQLQRIPLSTFGDMSEFLLRRILKSNSSIIYFVTDQYFADSIKGYERARRGATGSLRVKIQRRDQRIPKQLKKFFANDENKIDTVDFLLEDWSNESRFANLLEGRRIYFNHGSNFTTIEGKNNVVTSEENVSLTNKQEEADTKVFLCCVHARNLGLESACIETVDSDIAIYAVHFRQQISLRMFVKIGSGEKKRILDVSQIHEEIGEDVAAALPALHSFTGNDYTSAFHGIGKAKSFKIIAKNNEYQQAFAAIGSDWTFDMEHFAILQRFVCQLYGINTSTTDEARYNKFCHSKRTPEPQQLPPTSDALLCHCKRVNYVTKVIKSSLNADVDVPSPDGYGWHIVDGKLEIQWFLREIAPESVLNLVACSCKRSGCVPEKCVCKEFNLPCTDLCTCNCIKENEDELISGDESESDDSDYDYEDSSDVDLDEI